MLNHRDRLLAQDTTAAAMPIGPGARSGPFAPEETTSALMTQRSR